jgi:prepilin-type N-terminal cleavage/methylation domain-containing protein
MAAMSDDRFPGHPPARAITMRGRPAFTLVEMMVAMALVLFIMVILSQAFVAGLEAFRQLKAIGDMEARLRTVSHILRRDLQADHFEGCKRLSDVNFFDQGPPREGFFRIWQGSAGVNEGTDGDGIPSYRSTDHILHFSVKLRGNQRSDFFSAQLSTPAIPFPAFPGSPSSTGSPDPTRYEENANTYNSQWAEVAYFLRSNGTSAGTAGGTAASPLPPTPLFSLYRRQRLAVPDNSKLNGTNTAWPRAPLTATTYGPGYAEISCGLDAPTNRKLYFNTPTDLTVPLRRFGMQTAPVARLRPQQYAGLPWVIGTANTYPISGEQLPSPALDNAALEGSDLLLTDVISFDVRILIPESRDRANASPAPAPFIDPFTDLFDSQSPPAASLGTILISANSGLAPFRVFDTWTSVKDADYDYSQWNIPANATSLPLRLRILAVQISVRVWDLKTQRSRQVTLVQDM